MLFSFYLNFYSRPLRQYAEAVFFRKDKYINEMILKEKIMTIKINDKNIELKFSFRAEMLFEQINEKSFTAANTTEWIQQLFCYIIAMLGDGSVKYDEYLSWLDENPNVLYDFIEWYTTTMTNINEVRKMATKKESGEKAAKGTTAKAKK